MHCYLFALGIGPGDEVITPSMTWVSTVNLITLLGATPVFVDVDRDNLMVSAELLEQAITSKTRLMIPVHFAGAPLDLDPIHALARDRGLPLVEDTAHALGTRYGEAMVGSHGDAIFSLQAIKNISAAEGGVFVTHDEALADRMRRLRFHGLGADSFERDSHGRKPQAEVQEPGFKYNPPDLCSALALSQLRRLEEINVGSAFTASAIEAAVGLPSLLRGELKADEIQIEEPRIRIGINRAEIRRFRRLLGAIWRMERRGSRRSDEAREAAWAW